MANFAIKMCRQKQFSPAVRWTAAILLLLLCSLQNVSCSSSGISDPWGENQRPKLHTDYLTQYAESAQRFLGNQTHKDYFKLLRKDGTSLLIGARNVIYNISLPDLVENRDQRITWNPLDRDRELCLLKGKSEDDCQNYIRVLAKTEEGRLLVCGTNAYNPRCRYYSHNDTHTTVDKEFSGKGFCPYDPRHNSTSLYTGGDLYSGTVADFSASDSLIIKNRLRTDQYDFKQLNSPDFVNALEDEDHVYFFFRENAVEHINCGKTVFSRIGRVCKNDAGGAHKFRHKWTTFLKSRLNCSVPGNTPFYFNEIQATTGFLNQDKLVYGVFTTPDNSIAGSAICAFRLSDITESFELGPFKNQETVNSNWLPMSKSQIPEPRPGLCSNDSKSLSEANLNFIKRHSLMDWAVQGATRSPVFLKTSLGERLTVIAADPGVKGVSGKATDVLFVGTTNGRVLKVAAATNTLIEALQVFPYHVAVRNILVGGDQLIVLSDHEVNALPLHRCSAPAAQSCADCVALQDPYCAWDLQQGWCGPHKQSRADSSALIQDLEHGYHTGCPVPKVKEETTVLVSTSTDAEMTSTTTTTEYRYSVNSPALTSHPDALLDENEQSTECPACSCDCSDASDGQNEPTTQATSRLPIPTFVPFYDVPTGNGLGSSLSRDDKELDIFIEVPRRHQQDGYEPLDSSPHYKQSRELLATYSERTLALAVVATALLALLIGFLLGMLTSRRCAQQKQLHLAAAEIYDKTLSFKTRATSVIRGVGARCSVNHHHNSHQQAQSSSSASSSGSGSPPTSVLREISHIDSGYTTPSLLTSAAASVNTQETSASSSSSTASSGGPSPSASPNTTSSLPSAKSINLLVNVPPKSETIKPSVQQAPPAYTMPRNYSSSPHHHHLHQQQVGHQRQPSNAAQIAVMATTGGTLQKVKRIYL